ncbi:MAG TPA: cyclic nucleotide-binding domain-containing protein [candidate division Zixibacteria bacterium]|nr:cyclic nucleotide-binding domain-containing protein [candidate division Zixibacteria bacterium]
MVSNEENAGWLLPDSVMDKETQFRLASRVESRRFEPGETIIKQGAEALNFYLIVRGKVVVIRERSNRPSHPIATLGNGDYFGEIGLVEGVGRTATVLASDSGPVDVMVMDRATFSDFVMASDQSEEQIAAVVKQRIQSLALAKALPSLSPDELARVSPQFTNAKFAPGEVIIQQGDPADRFYILVVGRCEIVDHHPDGRDITVDWREPGEYFGEIGLLQNQPRTATVKAGPDTMVEVMALDRESFLAMTEDSKSTEMTIAQEMIQRMIGLAQAQ